MERIRFEPDGRPRFAGMGDFVLVSPDGTHEVAIRYAGEPPHGDSYHRVKIDGREFPGYLWGTSFTFTADSSFFAGSWMPSLYARRTIVIDLVGQRYAVLPRYMGAVTFACPRIARVDGEAERFDLTGDEAWIEF